MFQHVDESVDGDPLLAFSTEPGITASLAPAPPEPVQPAVSVAVAAPAVAATAPSEGLESLNGRVDRLERTLGETASKIASLKSEVVTLVGTIADIKKMSRRPANALLPRVSAVSHPRPRAASAIVGVVVCSALGFWGWTLSSRDPVDAMGASPAVAVQRSIAPEAPAQPVITLASKSAPPRPAKAVPAAAAPSRSPAPTRIAYVGTLSIDSVPGGAVFINRKAAGRTPLRVPNLRAGSHLVWIEREGYRRWTRSVQVPADRVTRVSADLEPLRSQ